MKPTILPVFQSGDPLSAAHLNQLSAAVSDVEASLASALAGPSGHGRRKVTGTKRKPWMCALVGTDSGAAIEVTPGPVLLYVPPGGAEPVVVTPELPTRRVDVNAALSPAYVWLHLDHEVTRAVVPVTDAAGAEYNRAIEVDYPAEQQWFIEFAAAPGVHDKSWPLALYVADDAQPLTQLRWGLLSACEVTAVAAQEGVLTPRLRERWDDAETVAEPAWEGMSPDAMEASLRMALDESGGLTMFVNAFEPLPEDDPFEEDVEPDPWVVDPGTPPPEDGPVDEPVRLSIGYLAGDGMASAEFFDVGGERFWRVLLDTEAVRAALAELRVPCEIQFSAGGSQQGVLAEVQMGLGACVASSGSAIAGSAELRFQGTVGDASKKTDEASPVAVISPAALPAREWRIPVNRMASSSQYIQVERTDYDDSGQNVRATWWYEIRVDLARLRRDAGRTAVSLAARRALSDRVEVVSQDSTVTAVLGGSLRYMTFSATLS